MSALPVRPETPFALADVPRLTWDAALAVAEERRDAGDRLTALFGTDDPGRDAVTCMFVFGSDTTGTLAVCAATLPRSEDGVPSLTPSWTESHMFEREIAEQFGVRFRDHPWMKPVRGSGPLAGPDLFAPPSGARCRLDAYPFLRADSEEMHEVGVGPVHAGIIEPGHFRFLCHGEDVDHLEISLGYQHRGIERRLAGPAGSRTLALAESITGDTVIGHATAHLLAVEGLARTRVPARAAVIRAIALELERCASHVGDLGALANDVGYLPVAAYYGRLRGNFLNLLMDLSGSRFGRGLLRPGGVGFDLDPRMAADFVARLRTDGADFGHVADLLFRTPSVSARFEGTGVLDRAVAEQFGIVGPPARASGCERDARHDFPSGAYRFAHIPVTTADTCDVAGRALVRRHEVERSIEFLIDRLGSLPEGAVRASCSDLAPESGCVSIVEGWRGEIVHVVLTDAAGRIARAKVIDPSFRNWTGLAMAMRGTAISDFPLCNKSFNLAYAGHDL